jgi:hypothetical protein
MLSVRCGGQLETQRSIPRPADASHSRERARGKVELGGVAGVVAPLVGKKPSDMHIWVYEGAAPTFLRFEGALFEGGPIWRIELANVVWH